MELTFAPMTSLKNHLNFRPCFVGILLLLCSVLPAATQIPPSNHVFLLVEENGSYASITNSTSTTTYMPWLVSQGNLYGHATNYLTNNAGSLLAYLWLSSGSCEGTACTLPTGDHSFGCGGGSCTSTITDDNIFREMIKTGMPWKLYAESIPYAGYMGTRTTCPDPYCEYDPHHNAPRNYSDIVNSTAQQINMVDFSQFTSDMNAGTLPKYSMIIPNDNHDAHDMSPAVADQWLQTNIAPLLNQPYFQPCGDGILIITFDNNDSDQSGIVYTAIIGPKVIPHYVSNIRYQHQNTLRTLLDALKITTYPGYSATASPMQDFFRAPSACPVLSATALSFGDQTVNVATTKPVTLTNNGNAAMSITSVTATGDYSQTNNCGTSLAIGASCTTTVTFKPTTTGTRSGTLTFKDSAPSGSQVVTLTGNGIPAAPVVSLSPTSLAFGNQLVGATATKPVTLTNTGTAALSITSVVATGDYTQTNNCGTSLAAGAACTTSVTFKPSTTGARPGTLTYNDSASGSPHVVSLSGTGTLPPQGHIDGTTNIADGTTNLYQTSTFLINGWAADPQDGAPVQQVQISVDGKVVGNAKLGLSRPDVATATGNTAWQNSGWSFQMSASTLATGAHTITATASDLESLQTSLPGATGFTVTALPPQGHIDSSVNAADGTTNVPTTGTLRVQGWAADPQDGAPVHQVQVSLDGKVVGNATLGFSRPDVATATGHSTWQNSGWTFSISAFGMTAGSHTVSVTAFDLEGLQSDLPGAKSFTVIAQPPQGYVDGSVNLADGATSVPQSGTLLVSGWAADPQDGAPVQQVQISVDGKVVGTATLGLSRPDVATVTGHTTWQNSGWSFSMSASTLAVGSHSVSAKASDLAGLQTDLPGSKTFTVFAQPPVGFVDGAINLADSTSTVPQSGTLLIGGWAADPQDGAPVQQVQVSVDGKVVGNATLGLSRPDVASGTGHPNWQNSGWSFSMSASTLAVGAHTVSAKASDLAGLQTDLPGSTTGAKSFTVK